MNNLVETNKGHFENDEYVFFWNGVFSNWHPADFTMGFKDEFTIDFTSSEQAMMFTKAVLFEDVDAAQAIMETDYPKEQKAIGRIIKGFDFAMWDSQCVDLVTNILIAKFQQNPPMMDVLLATGNKTIVEYSKYDNIWAIGMDITDPDILDESEWRGKNYLGICLMNARDILNQSN